MGMEVYEYGRIHDCTDAGGRTAPGAVVEKPVFRIKNGSIAHVGTLSPLLPYFPASILI